MIVIIDNFDSFVFNVARYCEELGKKTRVVRNDSVTVDEIVRQNPTHIILSPGPCGPEQAGISREVVTALRGKIPILGICLGHQVIAHAFGADVVRAQTPMHGKAEIILHNRQGIFRGILGPFKAGRYHSLIVCEKKLSKEFTITSRAPNGEVMSIAAPKWGLVGLQFHPESVLTEHGYLLMQNFIDGEI